MENDYLASGSLIGPSIPVERLRSSSNYVYIFKCTSCNKKVTIKANTLKKNIKSGLAFLCKGCFIRQRYKDKPLEEKQAIVEKIKKTNLKRYGVEVASKNEGVKRKQASTNLKKYGVESLLEKANIRKKSKNSSSSSVVKEKIKATNLKRYGVENPSQSEVVKEKIKATNLERYGVENPLLNPEIKEKTLATNLKRYGGHPTQSPTVKEKIKSTNLEKYGHVSPSLNSLVKEKQASSQLKYLTNKYSQLDYSDKGVEFLIKEDVPYFRCKKCGDEFKAAMPNQRSFRFRCFKCYPVDTVNSLMEEELKQYLSTFNQNLIFNDTTILPSHKELDIYIPEKKLAIEFDGIYWHSELQGKDKNYHLYKTEECEKQGIRLIHIFENEWVEKRKIVENILKKQLYKIYARECTLKEIDNKLYQQFCDDNHMQGYGIAKTRLGLFHKDKLMQIMSFNKSRFNINIEYEIIRECSKIGYQVVGGKAKLLKYFERNYQPKSIISYCDRRYFAGESYLKVGFELKEKTAPAYWYFQPNQLKLFNRLNFQKHKLASLPRFIFDTNLTEWENMQINGYNRIWDCGQLVFVKEYSN